MSQALCFKMCLLSVVGIFRGSIVISDREEKLRLEEVNTQSKVTLVG